MFGDALQVQASEWLALREAEGLRPNTIRSYSDHIHIFLKALAGRELTPFTFAAFFRDYAKGHSIASCKSIYNSVKQVSDTLFSSSGNAFREAVLVEYPRAGCWTIAFVTGKPGGEAALHLRGDYLSVYVPTTPNPTSGFFLMLPRSDVIALAMSVDEALKYVISMGVVAPPLPVVAARAELARN